MSFTASSTANPCPAPRRYIRATDSFEVVDPSTLYLGEED
jgi:hypothetical protein